jgi:hypothetical protein
MRISSVAWLLAGTLTISVDWPHYGGGPEQTRYSPLTQITPANVATLKVAWTYDTGDAFKDSEMQCQPVVANGIQPAPRRKSALAHAHSRPDVLGAW